MKLMVKDVDEKTIKKIAREYLSANYVTLKTLGTKYRTTPNTISNILWRGIAENIIDQRVAKYIYKKIVDKPSIGWYQRKLRWDEAFEQREKQVKELERDYETQLELENLNSLKDYYENAIASYNGYFFEDENAPSKEELEAKLNQVNRRIHALT